MPKINNLEGLIPNNMTTPFFESREEYAQRMADDGMGGLATPSEIADNISDAFEDIATMVTDVGDLPSTTSIRTNGSFTDAHACYQYLLDGGLVVTDGAGNTQAIGFVWVVKEFDEILWEMVYTVYIDDETN